MPYNPKYNQTTYDYKKRQIKRIPLDVPKQWYEEEIIPAAKFMNEPVNTFCKKAIAERIRKIENNGIL